MPGLWFHWRWHTILGKWKTSICIIEWILYSWSTIGTGKPVRFMEYGSFLISGVLLTYMQIHREFCLTLEIKEFRCYEVKIEESEKGRQRLGLNPGHLWLELPVLCHYTAQDTSGLSCQCSATKQCSGRVLGSTPVAASLFHFPLFSPHNIWIPLHVNTFGTKQSVCHIMDGHFSEVSMGWGSTVHTNYPQIIHVMKICMCVCMWKLQQVYEGTS